LAAALPVLDQLGLRVRGSSRLALAGFAAAGLALSALAAAFAGRAMILAAGLATLGRDVTLSGRTALWRAAADLVRRHWLGGWGLNYSVSPEVAARLTALFGVNHVHNALLDVTVNLGGLGAALLVLAVAGAVAATWPPARSEALARGVLLLLAAGWLLSGLSEDMAVRAEGPVAQFGLCALFGLYGFRADRYRCRRPSVGHKAAWRRAHAAAAAEVCAVTVTR
ncbi:O-antigen ligase family protein, partial [Caulobacter sp. S45]|uniref:O-antigen ligase family protein n=1 Tax=Caulobacter sp. S45 TaxID=1641861 RepID=UPI0015753150